MGPQSALQEALYGAWRTTYCQFSSPRRELSSARLE